MYKIKKLAALFLAAVMILTTPVTVFAIDDENFELSTNSTSLYEGMSYEVTATINNATAQDVADYTAFEWKISATQGEASINSKNNFSVKENVDSSYTVSETATFTMPTATATATITATFGSRAKDLSLTALQPIESFDVVFENNESAYFDSEINTLYLDRKKANNSDTEFVTFTVQNITPAVSDDEISIVIEGISNTKYFIESVGNTHKLSLAADASGKGVIKILTKSGKILRKFDLQVCIPATKYQLNYTPYGSTTASKYVEISDAENVRALISVVAGKPFSITAAGSLNNDDVEYILYTDSDLTNKALDKYYTVTDKKCDLSIDVPGTYYLTCKNRSKDNGKLTRMLGTIITEINVSTAFPIQKIELFKLDENQKKTNEILEEITLYTNTASTYNLENSVVVDPSYNTDTKTYMSSDSTIAKVDATTGVVTAVAKGQTTVWVRSTDNSSAMASVTVNVKIGVKSITAIKKSDGSTNIPSGHVQQLIATTNPTVVDEPIYWSSSNPDVLSVDSKTGVITAKEVSEKTPVTVYATTQSGISSNTPINVIPANRAASVTLSATSTSATFEEDATGVYTKYSDYFQSNANSRKPIIVTANAPGIDGEQSNDEYVWTINYNNGVAMSLDEASTEGLITLSKISDTSYSITPKKQGVYNIICIATTNVTAAQGSDPYDIITVDMLQCATTMSVRDAQTDQNVSGTIYLPIGATKEITVKTSTADNNKEVDPPTYSVTAGDEYISVSERMSDDGEGKTFTIEGLSYGMEASKVRFASKSGSKTLDLTIYVRNNLNDVEVIGVPTSVVFNNNNIVFDTLALRYGGTSVDSSLYAVQYANNRNVGTATITLTGRNEYNGSVRIISFKITAKPLSNTNTTFDNIADQYLNLTTREALPLPGVYCDGVRLNKDIDYTVSYKNNKRAGTATLTVKGIGNYKGSASKTFKVIDTAEKFKVSSIAAQAYNGTERQPKPVVKYYDKTLKKDVDYTLSYWNNVYSGYGYVTITGIGKYYGSISKVFTIKPQKCKITSIKGIKKGVNVKWAARVDINGYQVQCALNKKFTKGKKSRTINDPNLRETKFTKLKKSKKYYVRVRSFKIVDGKKIYSSWSDVRSIKTKSK